MFAVASHAATRDVTSFGAAGNGSADDTNAIQSAINTCSPGDSVYFPAGTYRISSTLTVPGPGCTLDGVRNTSTIKASGSADPMVRWTGNNTDTTIQNLIFDMNNFADGVTFSNTLTGGLIHYNKFLNGYTLLSCASSAKSGTRDTSIDHNIFQAIGSPGAGTHVMHFFSTISDTHFDYNTIDTFYQAVEGGGGPAQGTNNTIDHNTFIRGQRSGIEWFSDQNGMSITNNWFGQWRQCDMSMADCATNPNGFGLWLGMGQLITWAAGGSNINISNNFLKCGDGMANGMEWSAGNPSIAANNLIKVCTVTMYNNNIGSLTGVGSNIACTPYNTSYNTNFWSAAGPSNHYYTNCSDANVPADPPVPPPPFGAGSNQAGAPTFSPNGGTFSTSVSVTLNNGGTPGAVIHYTIDGSNPTSASPVYTAVITLNASATVKAMVTASGFTDSPVVAANFIVTAPAQSVTINLASPSTLSAAAGQSFTFTTHWSGGPTVASDMIFTHFMDASGNNAFADTDHFPSPVTNQWTSSAFSETRSVMVPANIPSGTYKVMVGLYDPASPTYDRLALIAGAGVIPDPINDSVHQLRYQIATLTVGPPGDTVAPVITAGFPKANPSTVTGQTTQLSVQATDNLDAPGALIYHWIKTAGPAIPGFPPADSNAAASVTLTFASTGSYTFQATAKDTSGNSSQPGSVSVAVNATATTVTVSPANPSVIFGGTKDFTASVSDQFGHAMTPAPAFVWNAPSSAGTINSSSGHFTAGATPGTYGITATEPASGKVGATNVTVSASNPPMINLTGPVNNQSYAAPAIVNWQLSWSAGTNPVSKIDLFENGVTIKTFTSPAPGPLGYTWINVPAGAYQLQAVATDSTGLSNGSAVVLVTVNAPANLPPILGFITTAPGDVDALTPGVQEYPAMTAQYLASVSDANSDTLTYQWSYTRNGGSRIAYSQGSVPNGSGIAEVSFTYPTGDAGASYLWILSVTDNKSAAVEQSLPVAVIARLGQGSLPQNLALVVPDTFLPVNATVGVSYNPGSSFTNLRYMWTVTQESSESATSGIPNAAPGAIMAPVNSNTSAPALGLAQWGLVPGRYALSVYATDGNTQSNTASKTVTLVSADISQMKVYPNPWRKDRHATKSVTFANLPTGSTVKVFTLSGRQVADLKESGGAVRWNLKNDSGDAVASGVYMYLVRDAQGNKAKGKIAVIK